MNTKPKTHTTISVPVEMLEDMQTIKDQTGLPISAQVRNAIKEHVKWQQLKQEVLKNENEV